MKEIELIINKMNFEASHHHLGYVLLYLRDQKVIEFINNFNSIKKDNISDKMLDAIESIIINAKSVYESDIYCDPYDDELYDKMLSRFKKFRPEPFGNNSTGLANAKYKYDILSGTLDKCHFIYNKDKTDDRDSIEDYIHDLPIYKDDEISMFVNHKEDGTSVTIDYEFKNNYYIAKSAISRGKKDYGEGTDVTKVIPTCKFDAAEIKKTFGYCPDYIGIQYEFLISNKNKIKLEDYLGQNFSNCRSAASGLLRRIVFSDKKESKILKSFMSLVPVGFDILDKYKEPIIDKLSWNDIYTVLCKTFIYGDIDMEYDVIHGSKKEILKQFEKISEKTIKKRDKLNHAIDGLVLTVLDKDIQKKLGRKNNINKWQVAYKFPEQGKKTVIRDVEITTGNFGYKEILLIVDPVELNGTKQFKAQIHSLNKFKKMNLRIGDEIILKLSGDVIPFGYKDSSCRIGDGKKIKLPKYCECGAPLEEEKNKLRCTNKKCPFRIIGSLNTFFVELNAKGIGEKTCYQLYNELGISKPSQILSLSINDFKTLKGFKDASAQLCMNTINDIISKPRTIPSILSALGIDSFRTSTANKLLSIASITDIINIIDSGNKTELIELLKKSEGIDKNAIIIADGLFDKVNELKALLKIMAVKNQDNKKYDKTIVISGLRHDEELENIANSNGFAVKDSGKKFDLLVIKDSTMMNKSKAKYALSKGIPILTRTEFVNKYKG